MGYASCPSTTIDAPVDVVWGLLTNPAGWGDFFDVFREELDCIGLDGARLRVNYHCNFELPPGWRGLVARILLRRELDAGPTDSLSRLKRAARRRYLGSQA